MNDVEVRPSPINGSGVFAVGAFRQGDVILQVDDSYVVTDDHPLPEGEPEYHCDWYADGRQVLLAPPACYVNHACDPNTIVRFIDGVRYDVARRNIPVGQEITHDYCIDGFGDVVWQCNCRGSACRKTIHANFFHLPHELQLEYLPYLSDLYKRVFSGNVEALLREAALV